MRPHASAALFPTATMTDRGGWKRGLFWRYDLHHDPCPRHDTPPDWERLSVRHKINVWNTAAELGGVPRQFASYLDLLDLPTLQAIQRLAIKNHVRERRATWDRIHEELKLLPRCPEHDTVIFFISLRGLHSRGGSVLVLFSSLFSSCTSTLHATCGPPFAVSTPPAAQSRTHAVPTVCNPSALTPHWMSTSTSSIVHNFANKSPIPPSITVFEGDHVVPTSPDSLFVCIFSLP